MRLAALLFLLSGVCFGQNWPDFRGPGQDGLYRTDGTLPTEWSETKNVAWKTPIHGRGWSSPVIWGEQVWLTTATPDGHKLSVVVVHKDTGKVLLDHLLYEVASPEPLGNPVNTYASPSPVIEEGAAYVHFGSYGTACFDTKTLAKKWERRDLPCRHFRGPGSSPLLYRDALILTMDGVDFQYLVALNKKDGKTVWKRDRSTEWGDLDSNGKPAGDGDFRKAYYTPSIFHPSHGEPILIAPGAKAAWAYHADTGAEIWQIKHIGYSGASRTVFHDGVAYINTGYPKSELWAVRLSEAKGDITRSHVLWKTNKRTPNRSSPVVVDGLLYMVTDDGILSCLDAGPGDALWTERLAGQYSASLLAANGLLHLCDEQGTTTLVKPGRKFEKVAENTLEEGMLASPAVAGRALFLRTKSALYRIETKG